MLLDMVVFFNSIIIVDRWGSLRSSFFSETFEAVKIFLNSNFICATIRAFLVALSMFVLQKKSKKKEECEAQLSKINAALASLESTRLTLLIFKGQFLLPYQKEVKSFEDLYNKRADELDLPKSTTEGSDYLSNQDIIKYIHPEWSKLKNPFTFFNPQTFYPKSLAEGLSFVEPEYLVTLHKAHEHLLELNHLILRREKEIVRPYRERSIEIIDAIDLHRNFIKKNSEFINNCLAFNQLCIEHLQDFYSNNKDLQKVNENIVTLKLKTDYEDLMPDDDYLYGYKKQLQDSIKKRKNTKVPCLSYLNKIFKLKGLIS